MGSSYPSDSENKALDTNPISSGSSSARRLLHDPWASMELLLTRLTDTAGAQQSILAAVEAARDAVDADAAFWYSRNKRQITSQIGLAALQTAQAKTLAEEMLGRLDPQKDVILWTNPSGRAHDNLPDSALLVAAPRTQGCIVTLSYDPVKTFDETDAKVARMAMKMLLSQRTQSATGTKQLLMGLLHSLTTIIDAKDPYTAGHSERVARIAVLITKQMKLNTQSEGDVYLAGLLHDVGKIGVRDDLLQRPGKLNAEEMEEIRQHPLIGDRIVASIKPFERLRPAVRNHHEWFNGKGYPDRLAGENIPILARVLAVADACDAMMSPRRFRAARSPHEIDLIFHSEAGRQFDPQVVKAFMTIRHEVYPPIYQKGIGESAFHAIENIVENLSEGSMMRLPTIGEREDVKKS